MRVELGQPRVVPVTAVAQRVEGLTDPRRPTSYLQQHPDTTLIVDRSAASMPTSLGAHR
jgi:hypothetical protein